MPPPIEAICCGHVCLDAIPTMTHAGLPEAGGLTEVGGLALATGGSVANTGLALHRLGVGTRLVARIGDDLFGREIAARFAAAGPALDARLRTIDDEPTSYTVVISPPDEDRRFLHCPGVNATFTDTDVNDADLSGARLLHFGYPPAMQAVCADDGAPLLRLLQRAKRAGLITSLDLCGVDASGWPGRIDWDAWLTRVLPEVDVFLPSADELASMTGRSADELLELGCAAVVIKDGQRGLRIETSERADALVDGWGGLSLTAGTFEVPVAGTTGAGDVTIAGFLAGLLRGRPLASAADLACAAGAFCVQGADAVSAVPDLPALDAFLQSPPNRRSPG